MSVVKERGKGKNNMTTLALKEYEKIKIKDPVKAKRMSTRGPADIYGLHPEVGGYRAGRIIIGKFKNGVLQDVEE